MKRKFTRVIPYTKAFLWRRSLHRVKARLGSRACNRLQNGANPAQVIKDMEDGFAAFKVAQEG